MASITGLQSGNFTDIDVIYSISIDGDSGQTGQVLSSDGENTLWIDGSAIDREDLTAANDTITISGGAYDGAVARTIQTNKVPNALTAGNNITFDTGTTYDGSGAITINATDNDNQLSLVEGSGITITNIGGLNRRIACDVDADTIDFDGVELAVQKVPNALTAGTNVSFATADGGTINIFNGGEALTLNATDTNTQLNLTADAPIVIDSSAGGLNKNVELNFDTNTLNAGGGALAVSRVPHVLTAGDNVSFVITANGSSASTYDGATGITITGTGNTQLNLSGGTGITVSDTGGLNRTIALTNNTISGIALGSNLPLLTAQSPLGFVSGAEYNGQAARTIKINPNIPAGLPHNCFQDGSGDLRMTINLSNFMANDDSSFYNLAVEDDGGTKTNGSLKTMNSSLEMVGYFIIPNGLTASAARIDITNASGQPQARTIVFESFTTYGATGFTQLKSGTSNSEQTFDYNLVGASDKLLLIHIITTSTGDHVRGGYIKVG